MVEYEQLTDEQQRAVDALDRNVTLTAGAGTGKTTTLTSRYLKMVELSIDEADIEDESDDILLPENILTTTFTERAANELEESIRTEITERISDLDVDEFEAWRTVADELEHGYIHTLHGFCARLLRENALSVEGVDPGFEPIDEDETTALIHDTVGDVLEEYETHDATRILAERFTRDQLRDVLVDLLNERPESLEWAERWIDATESEYLAFVQQALHPIDPDEAAGRLADPAFVDAVRTLEEIVQDPPDISTDGKMWGRAEQLVASLDDGFDDGVSSEDKQVMIAEVSQTLTKSSGERYASYTGAKSHWRDHPLKPEFDSAIERIVDTLDPEEYAVSVGFEVEANSYPLVTALAELTVLAAEEYETRKRRQNVLDFTDLVTKTVGFLQEERSEHVRQELREQFEYVMVDEFQDTDPRQWDLIQLLTATEKDTFDADNVFVVGDAKQSIYRFRNADVAQFQETAETLAETTHGHDSTDSTGDDNDQLSTNFRTLPDVLETINALFSSVFDEDGEPYEAAPQSLTPFRNDPAEIGSVEYLLVPTDEEYRASRFDHYDEFATAEPDDDAELEAMALADRLSQVLAEPYEVYPEDRGEDDDEVEPRDIEPDDIAILIRSRTNLKTYERALEEAEIPYSIASGLGFYETPEITALLNLFRTLADPADERAVYATLRSPLFGFTDDTLAQLKRHGKPLWEALGAAETEELAEAHQLLQTWRQLAGLTEDGTDDLTGSWAAFLTRVIENTGFLVSISAGERPQQARSNVEKFRQQLRGLSDDGVRSLIALVDRLEQQLELGGRESEAETTSEGVQILTIHDAKGMEFPFVVVPGIGKDFNDEAALGSGSVEFERIDGEHAVGLKAPSPDEPFELEDTIARRTLRERRREEERAEEKRILYVACTRARDHLLLTGLHDLEEDEDALSLSNLEESEPDSASSWRDWLQPELLSKEVCVELDQYNQVTRTLGDGIYTISLPTPARELQQEQEWETPDLELSSSPLQPEVSFHLSATDLAALLGGYGKLQIDQDARLAVVEELEGSPDERHGAEDPRTSEETREETVAIDTTDDTVPPWAFGEMVHRICELRPPESKWPHVMKQTLVDEGLGPELLTPNLQQRVSRHARCGIEYVQQQARSAKLEQQYDELYVTAEFDRGEISGYIDHLLVTSNAYHIIDYKTGDVTPDDIEADAEYYANQMKAYAFALNQEDSNRDIRVSLLFTELDQAWEVEWSPSEVQRLEEETQQHLRDSLCD